MKLAIAAGMLFVLFIGFKIASSPGDPKAMQRSNDQDAIQYCEAEYKKLVNMRMSPGALSIASKACDKMREDFRSNWKSEP